MKLHLEQIKANYKFHGKNSGFVDSGFVKTCDELVIGHNWEFRRVWKWGEKVWFEIYLCTGDIIGYHFKIGQGKLQWKNA